MSQHIAPTSHESRPETPESVTVHGSPSASGSGSTGTHRVAFQAEPPSFAQALHFSPRGQSCSKVEHSSASGSPSGAVMNVWPSVSSLLVLVLELGQEGRDAVHGAAPQNPTCS